MVLLRNRLNKILSLSLAYARQLPRQREPRNVFVILNAVKDLLRFAQSNVGASIARPEYYFTTPQSR